MEVMIRLTDEQARKLAYIQQQTNQNVTDLVLQAIDQQYEQLHELQKNPLDIFEELGLVGCIDGDPNLSANYKTVISDYLDEKQKQGHL
jgi:DNA polymerase III delta prime subunit